MRRHTMHSRDCSLDVCSYDLWTYVGNGAHDELTAGQTVSDHFTVVSQDSSASGTVTVTITGTNDAATVSSDSKAVSEGDRSEERRVGKERTSTGPVAGERHAG